MPELRNQTSASSAPADDTKAAPPLGSLLTDPPFVRIWIAGALVGTIRWLEVLAVGVYTYQATGSPFIVASMLFARMIPIMLLGAFAGAIAERASQARRYNFTSCSGRPQFAAAATQRSRSSSSINRSSTNPRAASSMARAYPTESS